MKTRLLLLAIVVVALGSAVPAQSVVVTKKKVTYTRPKPVNEYKKTFVVNYPKVKAASAALSRKIEAAIAYEKAFAFNLQEEINGVQWLEEADYEVLYNKNGLLNVELSIQGMGAYPVGETKSMIVDTKTGKRVLPGEVFVYLGGLIDMVKKVQKAEIKTAIEEIKANKDWEEPNPERLFETKDFTQENLKGFSIGDKGVTFYYDYEFAHAIQSMAPNGRYTFTWAQMKPYIRSDSVLGRLVR